MAETTGTREPQPANVRIFVLGDVNLDTLIVPLAPRKKTDGTEQMAWQMEGNFWRHRRRGGAWLLAEIINAALKSSDFDGKLGHIKAETYDMKANGVDDAAIETSLVADYLSSAALLGLFPQTAGKKSGDTKQVYRMERFLGWLHTTPSAIDGHGENDPYAKRFRECLEQSAAGNADPHDILVLHDRAGGFRHSDPSLLEKVIRRYFEKDRTWIIWHMYSPLAEGTLWKAFEKNDAWRERTIAVVKMECLRQAGMNLPRATSLEQESQLFVEGMKQKGRLANLASIQHIVAHQQREGVLHYHDHKMKTSCYYCPDITDDPLDRERGFMVGNTSILIAAIVRSMAWSLVAGNQHPEEGIIAGIKQGVVLDHLNYLIGFGDKSIVTGKTKPAPYPQLFETLTIAGKENQVAGKKAWNFEGRHYHVAAIPLESEGRDLATSSRIAGFLERQFTATQHEKPTTLEQFAKKIAYDVVHQGLRRVAVVDDESKNQPTLPEPPDTPRVTVLCPYEVHGKITTAYRIEIDRFASIKRILVKYLNTESWTTPLSIAVFGPPGSGKSLTVKQIFATVSADIAKRPLEFNLAQFDDVKDVELAFRKVQDEAVAGEVPLVFFDEFDTKNLSWLKYFLAPMQDGKFKAGESTYRIGRAVFVFAGGVSKTWDEFYEERKDKPKEFEDFKAAKGTDFVSRLRGYLDIESINAPKTVSTGKNQSRSALMHGAWPVNPTLEAKEHETIGHSRLEEPVHEGKKENAVDVVLMFRRAILLRSLLETYMPQIVDKSSEKAQIDEAVVRAFLQIPCYEHEARSMQAIIEMSQLSPRGAFQKSSLPANDQLQMHVDTNEFFRLMNPTELPD